MKRIKKVLYFPLASYFRFFAAIKIKRWHPKIVVVTGSNGKTTLLNLIEAQIGDLARYSHNANSSFGIPFDILGLKRKSLFKSEWIGLFLQAPFAAWTKFPAEKIYIVEADCDRPGEGKFLADLLKPEVVLWVSVSRTHAMNFERLANGRGFKDVVSAIAYEYGVFIEECNGQVVINRDNPYQVDQLKRTKAQVTEISEKEYLKDYQIGNKQTVFHIGQNKYKFPAFLPKEVFYAICMTEVLMKYLDLPFDHTFSKFTIPPGRSSFFEGIKGIEIIDSSYNSNLSSVEAILNMYAQYDVPRKWLVIGDLLEQGLGEQEEHEKLANILAEYKVDRLILLGPRSLKYTYPLIKKLRHDTIPIQAFENPKDILDYILENTSGGEVILFKGVRFMEGIIEHLLKNSKDKERLARREQIWVKRRQKWGL